MSRILRARFGQRKIAPEKPLIIQAPKPHGSGWFCGATDGNGAYYGVRGPTPETAYRNFKAFVEELDRYGLRWEVFP